MLKYLWIQVFKEVWWRRGRSRMKEEEDLVSTPVSFRHFLYAPGPEMGLSNGHIRPCTRPEELSGRWKETDTPRASAVRVISARIGHALESNQHVLSY